MKKLLTFSLLVAVFGFFSSVTKAQTSTPDSGIKVGTIDGRAIISDQKAETITDYPKFCGTSEYPNASVQIKLDGVDVATITTDSSGNWCYTFTSPVSKGDHTFTATVISAAVSDQLTFARVDQLTDTGSEILIALVIMVVVAIVSTGGYLYFKKVNK
ncbi:MAG: hypothetical protein Fur0024_0860 [Patescibacteria group bacterium]